MSDHVYRVIEVVGSSEEGIDAAIRTAVARAGQTTRNLDWFEVTQLCARKLCLNQPAAFAPAFAVPPPSAKTPAISATMSKTALNP